MKFARIHFAQNTHSPAQRLETGCFRKLSYEERQFPLEMEVYILGQLLFPPLATKVELKNYKEAHFGSVLKKQIFTFAFSQLNRLSWE